MKKIIGVIAIALTLILSIVYRQLTAGTAKNSRPRPSVPAVVHEVQENLVFAALLIQ
jgi:hypothetical protein